LAMGIIQWGSGSRPGRSLFGNSGVLKAFA
jgi:hypothetical protein